MKLFAVVLPILAVALVSAALPRHASTPSDAARRARFQEAHLQLPLYFEMNRGQSDPAVRFMAHGNGGTVFLTDREAVLTLRSNRDAGAEKPTPRDASRKSPAARHQAGCRSAVVRMQLVGSKPGPQVTGQSRLPGKLNYFIGQDPSRWQRNVPIFEKVRYDEVYPGIDLVYYGNQRRLEYDFIVAPGADPSPVRLEFAGVKEARVDARGDLVLSTDVGEVRQLKPIIYQDVEGERREVEGGYSLEAPDVIPLAEAGRTTPPVRVAFHLGDYDRRQPLVIDPLLVYSSYLGGSDNEETGGVDVDADGNAYVSGRTESPEFPHVGAEAAFRAADGDTRKSRIFVTKFNPQGSALIYSSIFGGQDFDASYTTGNVATSIAVTAGTGSPETDRNAWVTGWTTAVDFPTTPNALMPTHPRPEVAGELWREGFVTKLGPDGEIVYSTYFGALPNSEWHTPPGPATEVLDVATFGGGAFITGWTSHHDNPDTEAIEGLPVQLGANPNVAQPQHARSSPGTAEDAFVAAFSHTGSLNYCTYLGGEERDIGSAIAVDLNGVAYVTGRTYSSLEFPITPGAFQGSSGGDSDAFVTSVSQTGSQFFYSTYLGGSGNENKFGGPPAVRGDIAVDPDGNVYVTGATQSNNFPVTAGAFQPARAGTTTNADAFVTKIRPDASLPTSQELIYSTHLGGNGTEHGQAIAWTTGPGGFVATVSGITQFSATFPLVNPLYTHNSVFLTQLNAAGSGLLFSTRLAPFNTGIPETGLDVAHGPWGDIYVTGHVAGNWPTTVGAYRRTNAGQRDAWLMRIRPSEFSLEVTSCSLTPQTLTAAGGEVKITARLEHTIPLETVIATVTGPDSSTANVALQFEAKSGNHIGFFSLPANPTALSRTYSVVLNAVDESGGETEENCGAVSVVGELPSLVLSNCDVTPRALTSRGGRVTISATVSGPERVRSVFAVITRPDNTTRKVKLVLRRGVYKGVFVAPRNRLASERVYGVAVEATGRAGTKDRDDCGTFAVAAPNT